MNIQIKILYQLWIVFKSIECETIYSIKDNDNLDQYNMLCK